MTERTKELIAAINRLVCDCDPDQFCPRRKLVGELARRLEYLEKERGLMEPLIHSHITDMLPRNHPSADTDVYCDKCGVMIHAFNNECMQTWLETERGNFCTKCFPLTEAIDLPPPPRKDER